MLSAVEIEWDAPAACSEGVRAQASLDRLVAEPADEITGGSRVEVRVEESPVGWSAAIAIEHAGVSTVRDVEAPTCESLADAVGLIVAVAVDPLGASTTVTDAFVRVAAEPAPTQPIVVPRTQDVVEAPAPDIVLPERKRRELSGSAFVVGGGAVGVLPPFGGTLGGGLALGVGWLRVELSGHHRFRARAHHPSLHTAGADVTLTAGRASACFAPAFGRFSLPICGGLEAGAIVAHGFGIVDPDRATALWLAAVPQLRPTLRATRWLAFGLDLQLPVALARPSFAIDDLREPLFVGGPVGFRFGLAVELVFARTKSDEHEAGRARG